MIRAMNFKRHERGSMVGFVDVGYYGITIKGCRLMDGDNGYWLAFRQRKGENDGEVKYFDLLYFTPPERDHIQRMVIADLVGHRVI